jgi:quercetin dioxygenase-like cupin family protein
MSYIRSTEAAAHSIHGVRFVAYANPGSGSKEICAWRGEIPAGLVGVPHTISHEEVFYLLTGTLRFSIDGETADLVPGDAAIAPAGSLLGLENVGEETATMWVSTGVGLSAVLADGSTVSPPWAN